MTFMAIFPYAVGVLDLGAALVYLLNRQWALAMTWLCYAIASVALGTIK